jgi:RNA polymerase sigma-70 factor (ECF subfamily)
MERYKRPLFAFIIRIVNDYESAEDLFQETWLRVIRSLHTFRGTARFSTWLFQIALNLCRDEIRKRTGKKFIPLEEIEEPACESEIDPHRMMQAEAVRRMLKELPDKMREVIVLKFYHDMDDQEIAEVVGCPLGTVKTRYHRAIKILSNKWEFRSCRLEGEMI